MKSVNPSCLAGNGLWNHFSGYKKYHIQCGECKHSWIEKVSFAFDEASVICPNCKTQNTWLHSYFDKLYSEERDVLN